MKSDDALRALGILVGATQGPWDDDVIELWLQELEQLEHRDGAAALMDAARTVARSWAYMRRPTLAALLAAYDDALTERAERNVLPGSNVHCDGSGWVMVDDESSRPCARCNPAMAEVFDDADKLHRWRNGVGLDQLDVGVERVKHVLRYKDGKPAVCALLPEAHPTNRRHMTGVARAAYEAECRAADREPKLSLFDDWMADVKGR